MNLYARGWCLMQAACGWQQGVTSMRKSPLFTQPAPEPPTSAGL